MGRIKTHLYDTVYNLSIIYGFLVNEVVSKSDYVYKQLYLGKLICVLLACNLTSESNSDCAAVKFYGQR